MFMHKLMCFLPLAALALPACAQQAESKQAEPKQAEGKQVETQQGMIVVRDADTGELRAPTADEARALHPRTNVSAAGTAAPAPKMVTGPGGRRSVQLGERHMVYSVVTRGADGKLEEQCVHGAHAAQHAVTGTHKHGATQPQEHRQ